MPVRFHLVLERTSGANPWPSAYATAYCLRGAIVPFLRDAAGVEGIHGQRYSIRVLAPDDTRSAKIDVEFCLLSDGLVPGAYRALDCMRAVAHPVTIGDVVVRVDAVGVAAAEALPTAERSFQAELLDITFLSLTTFAAGDRRTRAVPDPCLVIKSWISSWNGVKGNPHQCGSDVVEELGRHLEPVDGSLAWNVARFHRSPPGAQTIHAPYTLFGFTGTLTLLLHHAASTEAAHWLPRLAWLANFAGTGYHAQIGLGATRTVVRQRSAGRPNRAKPPSSADAA